METNLIVLFFVVLTVIVAILFHNHLLSIAVLKQDIEILKSKLNPPANPIAAPQQSVQPTQPTPPTAQN